MDAAHFDFRLQPDSPAFKLGFVPIDATQIGLYGDPEWVRAPQRIKRQAYVPKPPLEPQPTPVQDDFEEAIPGMTPEGPTVSKAASIASDLRCGSRATGNCCPGAGNSARCR